MIEPFDLVIVDNYTPQLDGIALCRRLKPQQATLILLLADNDEEPIIMEAYQAGVDEYIAKPLSPRLFLVKVTAWLRRTGAIPAEETGVLEVGGLRLNMVDYCCYSLRELVGGGLIPVSLKKFEFANL